MDIILFLIGLIFLIVGILFLYSSVKELIKSRNSKNWSTTIGKIVASEVNRVQSTDRTRTDYEADVFYKYSVNDIEYSSNVVSFGNWSSNNAKSAQKIVNRYPLGKEVTVYYDPDMPEESVLESGTTYGCYFSIIFALFFVGVGIFIVFFK